jgi:hypothetical protein
LPAPLVDGDEVVEVAAQAAVVQAGRAAVGSGGEVVHLAGAGWLLAAGDCAVLVGAVIARRSCGGS